MKYLSLILFLFFVSYSFGQADLLEKSGTKYFYKDQIYKCENLGEVYMLNQESMDLYLSGRKYKRAANLLAVFGIPFTLGGILGLAEGSTGGVRLGALLAGFGVVVELVALIPREVGNAKFHKARKLFNYEMIQRHGYQPETSLSFGVTESGLGLVYQF